MKLVEPFKNMEEAVSELDNGGYFYNIFTAAHDGKITRSELSKAMHEFDDFDLLVLHLEMCLVGFDPASKNELFSKFDDRLTKTCERHAVQFLSPQELHAQMPISQTVIIKANLKKIDIEGKTLGVTNMPMISGDMIIYSSIPVVDTYNMYQVVEVDEEFLVGVNRKGKVSKEGEWYIGGVMKQSNIDDDDKEFWFFEALYMTEAK